MKKHLSSNVCALCIIYIIMFNSSCTQNTPRPDVSAFSTELKVERFESDLFGMDTLHPAESIAKLRTQYGDFFDLYMFRITTLGSQDSILMAQKIVSFVTDTNFRNIANDIGKTFGDFSEEKEELTQAFKYYNYYFPDKPIPAIITLLSAFSYPIVCDSLNLGIGLDMYLGKDYRYYFTLEPPLPNYLRVQMEKQNVVCDAMKGWAMSDYQIDEASARVIDMMISEGRIVTFLEYVLPDEEDAKRLGFTQAQFEWCEKNEKLLWSFFVDNKLLFSADPNIMSKYTNDGPTTSAFPKESPGNIGKYIGWKIVSAYLKKHPKMELKQLMEEKDMMKIYQESGYKPAK
ncbi:MAG: hypothetical protein KBF92_09255 [Bacteroidia bacterium]|nr:hypothetical protein [Bacteroidia bacterium]MBP9924005.1 hypothetical protein [Bacteroidia bacterium]